jgi:hypothetical protein
MTDATRSEATERERTLVTELSRLVDVLRSQQSESHAHELRRAAEVYEQEAKAESTASRNYLLGMLVMLLLAMVVLGAAVGFSTPDNATNTLVTERFLAIASLALPVLLAAAFLARLSSTRRRAASEIRRQRKMMLSLDPYLAGLPERTQVLYRAHLARRFFPRSVDELDAMEDDEFPDSITILKTIHPWDYDPNPKPEEDQGPNQALTSTATGAG